MWAAGAAAAENLQWTQGGVQVPVPPPVWDHSTTNDMLYTYIAAHNSYVSAVARTETHLSGRTDTFGSLFLKEQP